MFNQPNLLLVFLGSLLADRAPTAESALAGCFTAAHGSCMNKARIQPLLFD